MSVSKLLGLLLCNLFWSAGYSISKARLETFTPTELAFLRFFSAAVPLVLYCLWKREKGSRRSLLGAWAREISALDLRLVAVGLLTFFVSPLAQMTGLKLSR